MSNLPGFKTDDNKVRLDLLPPYSLYKIAEVLTTNIIENGGKYPEYNWAKGMNYNRLYRAALNHLFQWWLGKDIDEDSGLSHLAHCGCCILFLIQLSYTSKQFDNRPEVISYEKQVDRAESSMFDDASPF